MGRKKGYDLLRMAVALTTAILDCEQKVLLGVDLLILAQTSLFCSGGCISDQEQSSNNTG